MADGKWINDLRPEGPVEEAARRVLEVRLRVVQDCLPRAVHEAERDVEHVHQLRVGTRRADAALRIFRACLPGRVYRRARERLRGIRRAAGAARDWDVFVAGLEEAVGKAPEKDRPGLDFLIGYSTGQRVCAQSLLEAAHREEGLALDDCFREVRGEVRAPKEPADGSTLAGQARPLLGRLLQELEQAVGGDLKNYEHLHQVRIQGKRLRYAMEVFADCFAAPFRERLYPLVEEMQEVLGRANDSHVAGQRLEALRERLKATWSAGWERLRPGIEGLLRFHRRRLPQERRRFLKWWDEWGAAGAREVLAAPAGDPGA